MIIHIHLKAPIIIGKKKAHVCFYLLTFVVYSSDCLIRTFNSSARLPMFNSMKRGIENVSTAMEMKMKSRWNNKNGSEGSNLTKSSGSSLKKLPTPRHHLWVPFVTMLSPY